MESMGKTSCGTILVEQDEAAYRARCCCGMVKGSIQPVPGKVEAQLEHLRRTMERIHREVCDGSHPKDLLGGIRGDV